MAIEYRQLRSVILEYLRVNPTGQLNLADNDHGIIQLCRQRGWTPDDNDLTTIQRIFHELYFERIIITGSGPLVSNAFGMGWPFYRLTDHGRQALESSEYVPYDPDGYLERLRREIPSIDIDIVKYLEEALGCFRSGHFFAAAVMTGCASEKALILLMEAFGNAISDPAKKTQYENGTRSRMIKKRYDVFWQRLTTVSQILPNDLRDNLQSKLDQIFELIRATRNDAGHPTGDPIERETVFVNLTLFPVYSRRVFGLINHFSSNPVNLP